LRTCQTHLGANTAPRANISLRLQLTPRFTMKRTIAGRVISARIVFSPGWDNPVSRALQPLHQAPRNAPGVILASWLARTVAPGVILGVFPTRETPVSAFLAPAVTTAWPQEPASNVRRALGAHLQMHTGWNLLRSARRAWPGVFLTLTRFPPSTRVAPALVWNARNALKGDGAMRLGCRKAWVANIVLQDSIAPRPPRQTRRGVFHAALGCTLPRSA
jgi:hypothetical protein